MFCGGVNQNRTWLHEVGAETVLDLWNGCALWAAWCTGDFAAAVVVVGPVVVVVGNTAEIAGTFHNWEPFGATVDS